MAKRNDKPRPSMTYPVIYQQLEENDPGYDCGYRYMVEQVDGDRHFFKIHDDPEGNPNIGGLQFLKRHSMQPVTDAEFASLRAMYEANKPKPEK